MLDQDADGHLVRQPDVRPGEPALGNLAAQHLHVLGDTGGQPVAELLIAVEPLELVVRAGHLEGGPGDLGCARQRRRGARVEQPRPAPHQRDEEELGLRVQVERQDGAVALRLRLAARVRERGRGRPAVPAGNGDRDLQPLVEHRARADHGRSCVHQPAPCRVAVALYPRQPDAVPFSGHVEGVGLADVGDPGAFRRRHDHSGPPGETPPSGNRQVHLRSSAEYQLAAFGEPDDLARRGSHVRGHRASLGSGTLDGHPRIRGWRQRRVVRLAPFWRDAERRIGWQSARAAGAGLGGTQPSWGNPALRPGGARRLAGTCARHGAANPGEAPARSARVGQRGP